MARRDSTALKQHTNGEKAGMKNGGKAGMAGEKKVQGRAGKAADDTASGSEEATLEGSDAGTSSDAQNASGSESEGESDSGSEEGIKKGEEESKHGTFTDLGLIEPLAEACAALNFKAPTAIQREAIPQALDGRDIIGLAQTGSGKTAAFALPILHHLWQNPQRLYALVLAPTRELAFQISDQFRALGSSIGVTCSVIVGGMDMMSQSIELSKKPHIVVATPGRLQDHLENTKGFSLNKIKFLVFDEADKLLDQDFGPIIDKLLKVLPRERNTYLFSATMTTKVQKLQRASLRNPVKVEVSSKYSTVSTLLQYYLFFPLTAKDPHLIYTVNDCTGQSMIIFTRTVMDCQRIAIVLRTLGFAAVPLHGQLSQSARLGALNKFKSGGRNILVATDVASRGLDIPTVDLVINYDTPTSSKDYIHRVGRTARAGRSGKAVTLVTQYDVELLQRIELAIGKKLDEYPHSAEGVALLSERVGEAQRQAIREIKEQGVGGRGRRGRDDDGRDNMDQDDEQKDILRKFKSSAAGRRRGSKRQRR